MVKWLAQRFLDSGLRVAIVSRGYGAPNGQHNDEALELTAALPNVPHIQNRDRVAAARRAIQEFDPQWLILDDGFQHRRLARDINIVLLDALEPFGFEHVFPRGTLREPLTGLERADVVCLSRADAIAESQRTAIRDRVAQISPQAAWCELAHAANKLINSQGETQPLEFLAGRRVAAFCGIGNPAGFRHTLLSTSCELVAWREFPDHHSYTPADLSAVRDAALDTNSTAIICTQKDLVKICQHQLGHIPLWAVNIEMRFLAGQETLDRILDRAIRPECE